MYTRLLLLFAVKADEPRLNNLSLPSFCVVTVDKSDRLFCIMVIDCKCSYTPINKEVSAASHSHYFRDMLHAAEILCIAASRKLQVPARSV